jgi:sarcosine/dimethylglycine N-methyltransferase
MAAMDDDVGIKSMPLYVDIHRINNELEELGIAPDQPLTPDVLYPFDQLHYHGIDAVRAAAGLIGLGRSSRVLEIGSGLGGPARYLAQTVGNLTKGVTHVRGDALTHPLEVGGFDAAVSWLAIHHIPERAHLFERLAHAIRPGGHIYIEDLVIREASTREDFLRMKKTLYGITLTDTDAYAQDLDDAGFDEIAISDMTASWAGFCAARAKSFRDSHARQARVHGEAVASRLQAFFNDVAKLFAEGFLGGVRIVARRA